MKKLFTLIILLLSTTFAFSAVYYSESTYDSEEEVESEKSSSGFKLYFADTYCNPSIRLQSLKPNGDNLATNGFTMELGKFNSDEDGLIDIISDSLFGMQFGSTNISSNSSFSVNYGTKSYYPLDDGFFCTFYAKEDVGVQLNLLLVSFGATIGMRAGYDFFHYSGWTVDRRNIVDIFENTFYADIVNGVYASLNLGKLKFMCTFDVAMLPIVNVNFDSLVFDNGKYSKNKNPVVDWFGEMNNDISFGLSAVFFF